MSTPRRASPSRRALTCRRARTPRRAGALALAPAVLLLSGCGSGLGEPRSSPSTVTVTAAPTAAAAPAPSSEPSPPPAVTSAPPAGDPTALPRQERGHDVAFVASRTDTPDGVVLAIDRLTVVGLPDEQLAASGTPVRVDDGAAFTNQAQNLYEAGVSPQARFFLTTCTASPSGPSIASSAVDLDTFLAAAGTGTAVSIVYADGLVDRAETNPRC